MLLILEHWVLCIVILLQGGAQQDLRASLEVQVRPHGGGERGQRRPDRAGAPAGGQTPHPDGHAPLEEVPGAPEPGPRTPDGVSSASRSRLLGPRS